MNKFLLIIILIGIFIFLPLKIVSAAQTGCGDAQNTNGNRCCSRSLIHTLDMKVENKLGSGWDIVLLPINQALQSISVPFNEGLYDVMGIAMKSCAYGAPSTPSDTSSPSCICIEDKNALIKVINLCNSIQDSGEKDKCSSCLVGGNIWSSIGCIQSDMRLFIQDTLLRMGVGIAGGISLLCIMFAAFQMQTSGGNAEKLKKAQELLTNCITGLMVIIFSMLILKIIGVDILRIPGFS